MACSRHHQRILSARQATQTRRLACSRTQEDKVSGFGYALPWSASLNYDSSVPYYYVPAPLEGYGNIRHPVTEVMTTYCSNASPETESLPLASGHASGGHHIAQEEYTGGHTGNATPGEPDAGC